MASDAGMSELMKKKDLMIIGGAGGGSPSVADDTLASDATIEFIDGICEGEIEGFATADPLESIYYNDTPLRRNGVDNFEDIAVDYRLGTQDQTHFEGEADSTNPNASLEFTVGVEVTKQAPVTRTISTPNVNAVAVTVVFPNGIYRATDKGDIETAYVDLEIRISCAANSYVPTVINSMGDQGSFKQEKTSSSFSRSIEFSLADYGVGPWDISVHRISENDEDLNYQGGTAHTTFNWATYTEIIYAKLRYPNTVVVKSQYSASSLSSVPKRGFVLKGMIVDVPTPDVYDPIARTYTGGFWSGNFVRSFTRNPAWILFDLLSNPRYGLGNEIEQDALDKCKWDLFTIAQRCDELVPDGKGGQEPRYSLDLYIGGGKGAKSVVQDIAASFDGMAYWGNGTILVTQDAPKQVKAIFTNANVVEGRFAYSGAGNQTRYTACLVQWNNPETLYKTEVEYVEDPDGLDRFGYREKSVVKVGCTSRAAAHRFGKSILLSSRLETDTVVFSVGLEGMVVKPGDVVGIRDITRTADRLGGRVAAGSTTSVIELDAPVTIAAGEQHYISIVLDDGEILTGTISNAPGDHQTINLVAPLPSAPNEHNVWAVYTALNESKLYTVIAVGEGADRKNTTYSISCTEYVPEKFALIDSAESLQASVGLPWSGEITPPPTNLNIRRTLVADEGGLRLHMDVSWTASDSRFVNEYVVEWAEYEGTLNRSPDVFGVSYRIEDAKPGVYVVQVTAKSVLGVMSEPVSQVFTLVPMFAVKDVSITNVAVRGIGTEFFGRNAEFSWETDADVVLDIPTIYSNGIGGGSKWFRDFEVNIFDADGITLRRTEYVTEFAYSYTYEKNVQDGNGTPSRTVVIKIKARDEFGNVSIEGSMTATNNPPTAFPTIELLPSEGNIVIKFDDPVDPDYSYIRIFGSMTTGFVPDDTPGTGNLLWEGSDNYISFPVTNEFAGVWYLRAQLVDEFGLESATYTPEISQEVFAVVGQIDPVLADTIVQTATDFNGSNNRNADPIPSPTVLSDGTAIDHTNNPDGTIDVSFEWDWNGGTAAEGTIDGFGIYVHADVTNTPYVFVGNSPQEIVFQVPAHSRTYIWRGVPANLYYTVGVIAYRKVDPDIAASGLIYSALVTANGADENPYHAPTTDPAAGDITTTINGVLADHVNVWTHIDGVGRPFDNADVTADQIAGSGVNILNGEYSIVDADSIPPYVELNGVATLDAANLYFGQPLVKLTASAPNAQLFMAANTNADYNFMLTPNKKWIISMYVKSDVANAPGQLHVRTSELGAYHTVSFLTSPTPNTPTRVSGMLDLTSDPSTNGLLRIDNDAGAGVSLWFTASMLEEMIGNVVAPSAYARPTITTLNGVRLADLATSVDNYNQSNDANNDPIAAPTIAVDGTAIDHVNNPDGTIDISFDWSWSGNDADIDGFAIYAYGSASAGAYVFGTDIPGEVVYNAPADKRSYIWRGVPANLYYTVGILAYRYVNKAISATGLIVSPGIVQPSLAAENPYHAPSLDAAAGDITTTINGIPAGDVNKWTAIQDDGGKPENNADVTANNVASDTTNVNGIPSSALVADLNGLVSDFNSLNNQNYSSIVNPYSVGISHVLNNDGSSDVKASWSWSGSEGDIDGFAVFVKLNSTSSPYTFGTSPSEEITYQVPADKRSFKGVGVPTDRYYTIAVLAYRKVTPKTGYLDGVIYSSLVYAPAPYRPSNVISFQGQAKTIEFQGSLAVKDFVTEYDISVNTLAAIVADLGTVNAGFITGTAGIDITGNAIFRGSTYENGSYYSVVVKGSAYNGLKISNAGSSWDAIQSYTGTGMAGFFQAVGGTGVSTWDQSGIALDVVGPSTFYGTVYKQTTELVSGWNAEYCGGYRSRRNNGGTGGFIPLVENSSAGVMEIGKYIDFHEDTGTGDYNLRLQSSGNKLYSSGGVVITGDLTWSGTATGTYSSDRTLKKNIKTLRGALSGILKLRGVSFKWKESGEDDFGVIAQELLKVFPELVKKAEGGKLGVKYLAFTGIFIEAIKDIYDLAMTTSKEVKELSKELDQLKKQLKEMQK